MPQVNPLKHFTFCFGEITITSNFDSGNLVKAQKNQHGVSLFYQFNLYIGPDHPKNNYRAWFYFKINGVKQNEVLIFTIRNMGNQVIYFQKIKLLSQGLTPVVSSQKDIQWKRIAKPIPRKDIFFNQQNYLQFNFEHVFDGSNTKFAFCYPWSLQDNNKLLTELKQSVNADVYFHRTILINTKQYRRVDLVTISSMTKRLPQEQAFDDKNMFPSGNLPKAFSMMKKAIFIGARVHPGQVPASHVMTGILKFLSSEQPQAKLLRERFVFYIVPIINPDGVYRGNYRTDGRGVNLNRYYLTPSFKEHPSIYGIKKWLMYLTEQKKLFMYLDLHAHAGRKGCFIYGNCSNSLKKQLQICLYPKLLSIYNSDFDYESSNFTQNNMYIKDKRDAISKEGAGRVAIYKHTKLTQCWTLQCNYNMSRIITKIPQKSSQFLLFQQQKLLQNKQLLLTYKYMHYKQSNSFYTLNSYYQLGRDAMQALLDLVQGHPQSRLFKSVYRNMINLKLNLSIALMRMVPYRFEPYFRRILQSLSDQHIEKALQALYWSIINGKQYQSIQQYLKGRNLKLKQTKAQTNLTLLQKSSITQSINLFKQKDKDVKQSKQSRQKYQRECKQKSYLVAKDKNIDIQDQIQEQNQRMLRYLNQSNTKYNKFQLNAQEKKVRKDIVQDYIKTKNNYRKQRFSLKTKKIMITQKQDDQKKQMQCSDQLDNISKGKVFNSIDNKGHVNIINLKIVQKTAEEVQQISQSLRLRKFIKTLLPGNQRTKSHKFKIFN